MLYKWLWFAFSNWGGEQITRTLPWLSLYTLEVGFFSCKWAFGLWELKNGRWQRLLLVSPLLWCDLMGNCPHFFFLVWENISNRRGKANVLCRLKQKLQSDFFPYLGNVHLVPQSHYVGYINAFTQIFHYILFFLSIW